MSVGAHAEAPTRPRAAARALSPAVALASLVALSAVARVAVAWSWRTPLIFPDEYIYAELGRSIAATGQPLVRGGSAHFPSLLLPLLESPAWLAHDVAVSYRVVQALQALWMSLAAVPAYLLARRVRLSHASALAAAALALCVPDFVYAPAVVAEALAYPLVLAALLAGVHALERPTLRRQLVFLALAGLAALARIQFVVLPAAYLVAAAAVGLRERRLRAALREHALLLGLAALGAAAVAAVGLGYYADVAHLGLHPLALAGSAATNLLVLAFAAGFVVVPAGLLGYGAALARPRSRAELAFAALGLATSLAVVAQAALYGAAVHERYTFYALPLLAIAFLLAAGRGFPGRLLHALVAALLVVAATREPLSTLGLRGEVNAPVLAAVHWLRLHAGSPGSASLLVLTAAIALTAPVVLLARRPPLAAGVAVAAAAALSLASYGLAADFYVREATDVRVRSLPTDPSWVDASGLGPVALLQAYGGLRTDALEQLFWNRSLDRVLLLPGADPVDVFRADAVVVGRDGSLAAGGRPLRTPLLVDGFASTVRLQGARLAGASLYYRLWRPTARPRLALYFAGRYSDGWVAPWARVDVWPSRPGTLHLRLALPQEPTPTTVKVELPGGRSERLVLQPQRTTAIALPVCAAGPWHAVLTFRAYGYVGNRRVAARASVPRFVPGAAACATARPAASSAS